MTKSCAQGAFVVATLRKRAEHHRKKALEVCDERRTHRGMAQANDEAADLVERVEALSAAAPGPPSTPSKDENAS